MGSAKSDKSPSPCAANAGGAENAAAHKTAKNFKANLLIPATSPLDKNRKKK
jgi:hypothetical protein